MLNKFFSPEARRTAIQQVISDLTISYYKGENANMTSEQLAAAYWKAAYGCSVEHRQELGITQFDFVSWVGLAFISM